MAESKKKASGTKKPSPPKRPRLVLPESLEAVYTNIVRIAHTPSEVVFDFGQLLPGDPKAPIKARVLMSPLSAKLMQAALSENLSKYESTFGKINIPRGKSLADSLFRSPQSPQSPNKPSGDAG